MQAIVTTFIAALITLSFSAVPARAAGPSFDCAKMGSDDEKAICGDPGLAELDLGVAKAYKAAVAAVAGDQAAVTRLRDEQRAWLGWRSLCEYQASDCLRIAMQRRISLLRSLADAPELVPRLRWATLRNNKKGIFATYPTLDDGSPQAAAFDAAIKAIVMAEVAGYGGDNEGCGNATVCPGVSVVGELFLPTSGVLSVQFSTLGFYGVPTRHRTALTFDLKRGRPLVTTDIFAGQDWRKAVAGICLKTTKQINDSPPEEPSSDLLSLNNWRFEPEQAICTVAFPGAFSSTLYYEAPIPGAKLAPWLAADSPIRFQPRPAAPSK